MTKYPVIVELDGLKHYFYVSEYAQHNEVRCKFNVYYKGELVATFTLDAYHILHLCENYGNLNPKTINLVAGQIKALYVYGFFEQ